MMMGVSVNLARFKYLTDDEKDELTARKLARAKDELKAQAAQRSKEAKKSGSEGKSVKAVVVRAVKTAIIAAAASDAEVPSDGSDDEDI